MGNRWRRVSFSRVSAPRAALAAGGLALFAGAAGAQLTEQELHFLYEVNRARHDPPAWAAEYGLGSVTGGDGQPTNLVGVEPRPPLAMNGILVDSSGFKAEEMAAANYFDHQSHVAPDFLWPNELVRNVFGYPLPTQVPDPDDPFSFYSLQDDSNQIESLAAGGGPLLAEAIDAVIGLIVDSSVPTLGHRKHLLAMTEFNTLFSEAGAGYGFDASADFANNWAFHTGVTDPAGQFLTGVAFDDGDGDDLFDPGEGLAGVTVSVGAAQTTTNGAGGWSLPVDDGTHAVSCQGGGFTGTGSAPVAVAGANRQVDCISGFDGLVVDFVAVWEPPRTLSGPVAVLAVVLLARRRRAA